MMTAKKKYLGVDFGDKRVGLALAETGSMAVAFKIITRENDRQLLADMKEVIKSENVDEVVIGLPLSMSGGSSQRTDATQQFIDLADSNLGVPVHKIDERLSSKLFERQGVKKDLDKHSAAAILDQYLSTHE